MGMKLRALIMDDYKAQMEQGYLRGMDVITLKNVPCEMTFIADGGWMEHEGEEHQYLPVFHLSGHIVEIRGNFPYNVSALSFGDTEGNPKFQKDILYYMTPDELSKLVEVAKFYTKRFQLPEILTHNEYSLPVLVNLTIVPPPNPLAYEQASFDAGLTDTSVNGIDKNNLPIFYIGFAGTGVNRKKDKLLDYYGIDFDNDFEVYALTAESSGYTNPTLMDYLVEPVVEEEMEPQKLEEVYLTPEQEAEMKKQPEKQKEDTTMYHPEDDYQMTDEDMLLAEADKNVERRIERIRQAEMAERQKQTQAEVQPGVEPEPQKETEVVKETEVQKEQPAVQKQDEKKVSSLSKLEQLMKSGSLAKGAVNARNIMKPEVQEQPKTLAHPEKMAEPQPVSEEKPSVQEKAPVGKDVTEEALEALRKKDDKPGTPQTFKAVEVEQKQVSDAAARFDNQGKQPKEEQTDGAGLDVDEKELSTLAAAQGADVADADLQRKVDEAKAKMAARQTAVDIAQDRTEAVQNGSREVSSALEQVAEAAESANQGQEDTPSL